MLAKSGESIEGLILTSFGPPAINDRGTVAFQSWLSGKITTAIFTPTAVLVKVGDTIGGKTFDRSVFCSRTELQWHCGFYGRVFGRNRGLHSKRATGANRRYDRRPATNQLWFPGGINDAGLVAFFGTSPEGAGIFTQTSLIAKTGDTICGKTLTGLGQPAINNSGVVAFTALFSDRSSAVIVARPIIVPAKSLTSVRRDQ